MKINNVELEDIDICDADVAEKYEKALAKVLEEAEKAECSKGSVGIRAQCTAVFNCFNTLFGEGTDKKVFGDKVNLRICLKAFEELINHANEQKNELTKIASKYSPNRAQIRAKK